MIKPTADSYPALSQLVMAYLNQDMDMMADSVPEAIAVFAKDASSEEHGALRRDMAAFKDAHKENVETVFHDLYWFDFEPKQIGQTVNEFFAMVAAILTNPNDIRRFLDQ